MSENDASTNQIQPTSDLQLYVANRPAAKWPPPSDWIRHRTIIRKLYVDERRALKEVKAIMADEYKHRGTTKMYKSRLKQWGIRKNRTWSVAKPSFRQNTQPDSTRMKPKIPARGKLLDLPGQKIVVAKNVSEIHHLTPDAGLLNVPSSLDSLKATRIPSHVSSLPQTVLQGPGMLKTEHYFRRIRSYFDGSFANRRWSTGENEEYMSIGASGIVGSDSYTFYNYCRTASYLIKQRSSARGFLLLSKASALIPGMLRQAGPQTLDRLIDSFLYLKDAGLVEVVAEMQNYLGKMATIVLQNEHPWYEICRFIALLDPEEQEELLARSWDCVLDAFVRASGPLSIMAIQCQVELINRVHGSQDLCRAETLLRNLLATCEQGRDMKDPASLKVLVVIGYSLIDQGNYAGAEAVAEDVLGRARNVGSWSLAYELEALELFAWAQCHQGKNNLAEHSMREAMERYEKTWGRDATFIRRAVRLETWLHGWGRTMDADIVSTELTE